MTEVKEILVLTIEAANAINDQKSDDDDDDDQTSDDDETSKTKD